MKWFKKWIGVIVFMALVAVYFSYQNRNQQELDTNGVWGIAKVIDFYWSKSHYGVTYTFKYKGKWYSSGQRTPDGMAHENYLNNYYSIKLLPNDPENSKIFLGSAIKDSLKIVNAGFKLKPR